MQMADALQVHAMCYAVYSVAKEQTVNLNV